MEFREEKELEEEMKVSPLIVSYLHIEVVLLKRESLQQINVG